MKLNLKLLPKVVILTVLIELNTALCTSGKSYINETNGMGQQPINRTSTVCCEGYVPINEQYKEIICYPECKNCLKGYCAEPKSELPERIEGMILPERLENRTLSNSTANNGYSSPLNTELNFGLRILLIIITVLLTIQIKRLQDFQLRQKLRNKYISVAPPTTPDQIINRELPQIPNDYDLIPDDLYDEVKPRPGSFMYLPMIFRGKKPSFCNKATIK